MIERVLAKQIPVSWVAGDNVYGSDGKFRRFLEQQGLPYVLAVAPNHFVWNAWAKGRRQVRVDTLVAEEEDLEWHRLSAGEGAKGPRLYDWAWVELDRLVPEGWSAWIVARRSLEEPHTITYFHACAPSQTSLQQIVTSIGRRWRVEEDFERGKGEAGLDQYEVRTWTGWYRHITLSMLALVCATLMQRTAQDDEKKKVVQQASASMGSMAAFKRSRG